MKSIQSKLISGSILSLLLLPQIAFSAKNPTSAEAVIYGVWVAADADCKDAKKICTGGSGKIDMLSDSPLCSGVEVTAGTYNCVIIEMSDTVTFKPSADAATAVTTCKEGTSYTVDLCNASMATQDPGATTTTACRGTDDQKTQIDDHVFLYLHTGTTVTQGVKSFQSPDSKTDKNKGLKLSAAWAIGTKTNGKLYFDFTDAIYDKSGVCSMYAPLIGLQ